MENEFSRMELLYGAAAMENLKNVRVAVFGLGGVGGYVVEALARSGVGALDLIDADVVSITNLNRQILATRTTLGQAKVEAAAARIAAISPTCHVQTHKIFFLPDTRNALDFSCYAYVVDAIDTVAGKLAIIEEAQKARAPVISSMGAGNKLNPAAFAVADIYATSVCPLARVMRRECRQRGIKSLKVVYSTEKPLTPLREQGAAAAANSKVPGSVAFVPAVAGLIMAGEVVNDLTAAYQKKL